MSEFRKKFIIPIGKKSRKEADKIIKDTQEKINLGYGDYWIPNDDCYFVDWNKYSMDELADYLEDKWKFSSSGEALAILKMVDFYRKNKNKL